MNRRDRAAVGDPRFSRRRESAPGLADGRALTIPVALGRGGILANKREGDGGTPRGTSVPGNCGGAPTATAGRRPFCRPGPSPARTPGARIPATAITISRSGSGDGQGGDRLKRDDHLYDFIIEIDHNTRPRIAGRGSAVFLHLARDNFGPTAGCVSMTEVGDAATVAAAGTENKNHHRCAREQPCSTRIRSRRHRGSCRPLARRHQARRARSLGCGRRDRAEGYAVQARSSTFSGKLFGWKIAATSEAGQKHINVAGPLAGRIMSETVIADGGTASMEGNAMRVGEPEFAFRMGRDLPPRPAPYTVERGARGRRHACIRRSRFRIRALPISPAPARRSSSPTMPARICSCWAQPTTRELARAWISSRSGRSNHAARRALSRPRQERARRSPRWRWPGSPTSCAGSASPCGQGRW